VIHYDKAGVQDFRTDEEVDLPPENDIGYNIKYDIN
jgi:hypothetical protein